MFFEGKQVAAFTSRCSVYRNAAQLIPHNTPTKVIFNLHLYDNDTEFVHTGLSRFIAKKAGVYHVSGQIMYLNISVGILCQSWIVKNDISVKEGTRAHYAASNEFVPVSGDVPLEVGGYIELWAKQANGNSRDIQGISYRTYMDIHRIA